MTWPYAAASPGRVSSRSICRYRSRFRRIVCEGFSGGKELRHYWSQWSQAFQDVNYILLYKGEYIPTTRNPQTARARIEPVPDTIEVRPGEPVKLSVRLTNTGDTRWLAGIPDQAGWTRLGGHLHASEPGTPALDYDLVFEVS